MTLKTQKEIEFDLSGKRFSDDLGSVAYHEKDAKEFIKRQIERIDLRIEDLSEFDGLGEVMLQKAELRKFRRIKVEVSN